MTDLKGEKVEDQKRSFRLVKIKRTIANPSRDRGRSWIYDSGVQKDLRG